MREKVGEAQRGGELVIPHLFFLGGEVALPSQSKNICRELVKNWQLFKQIVDSKDPKEGNVEIPRFNRWVVEDGMLQTPKGGVRGHANGGVRKPETWG